MRNSDAGARGEKIARRFLEKKNFRFVEKNFKTPRWGEIDLVMRDGEIIVFVEVKARSQSSAAIFGGPFGAINSHKLETLKRAAQFYLVNKGHLDDPARIDAVSVVFDEEDKAQIEHFPNIWVKGLA